MDLPPENQCQNQQKSAGDDTEKKPQKINWRKARKIAAVFVLIETFSLVLWQVADKFNGFPGDLIHFVSECGLLAGCAFLAHKISERIKFVLAGYFILCAALGIVQFSHKSPEPPPHFKSLTDGTEPTNQTIEGQIDFYSKQAAARQWQPPELPPQLPDISGGGKMVTFKIGGGVTIALPVGAEGWHYLRPYSLIAGEDFTPYIISNRLYIKIKTPFGDAQQMIEMNNEWPPKIPAGWDRNFSANSFEIVDEQRLPVLQVRYDSPNKIEINGVFVASNGAITIAFGEGILQQRAGLPVPKIPERESWFKYPSKTHLGELVDQ